MESYYTTSTGGSSSNSDNSDIGIGFSDRILLGVSIVGFTALIYVVHSLLRNSRNSLDNNDDDDGLTDDERLLRVTDVSTLNRSQRRARAKVIMKEQRRAQQPAVDGGDNNNINIDNNIDIDEDALHDDDNMNHTRENRLPIILSRKERQQHAKATEKEERRLFQEERERQQHHAQLEAQRQKKERLIAATQRLLDEEHHKALERTLQEEQERDLWYAFIPSSAVSPIKTVSEFINDCQTDRVVDIETIATQYNVEPMYIVSRIEQLLSDGRIAGFFHDNEYQNFIYVSDDELYSIASTTQEQRDFVSLEQFTTICRNVIQQ